jgi:hypothetical protein
MYSSGCFSVGGIESEIFLPMLVKNPLNSVAISAESVIMRPSTFIFSTVSQDLFLPSNSLKIFQVFLTFFALLASRRE